MRIFRATNTSVIKYLADKIRPADGVSREQYLANLAAWLVNAPDTVFVQVVFEEDNSMLGFMVCYLPPGVDFIFISQLWCSTPKLAGMLLARAIGWGDNCGRTQIRMETESDHDDYSTLWKLDTLTITKGKNFSDMDAEWFLNLSDTQTENTDGIPSSTTGSGSERSGISPEPAQDAEHADPGAEGHQPETGEVLPGAVPPVHGQAGA